MSKLRSLMLGLAVVAGAGAFTGCYSDYGYGSYGYGGYAAARPVCAYRVWIPGRVGFWGRYHPGHWRCG